MTTNDHPHTSFHSSSIDASKSSISYHDLQYSPVSWKPLNNQKELITRRSNGMFFKVSSSFFPQKLFCEHKSSPKWLDCTRGGQQVDRDRLVDRRSSAGRSRLILRWIDKITKKNTFNQYQYSRKYIKFSINWLVTHILWCLLWWLTIG